jgi:hypothetical protein
MPRRRAGAGCEAETMAGQVRGGANSILCVEPRRWAGSELQLAEHARGHQCLQIQAARNIVLWCKAMLEDLCSVECRIYRC